MKNIVVILLIAAGVGLFLHDKQQTADLAKAQAENDQLSKQHQDDQAAINGLKLQVQQLTAEVAKEQAANHFASPPAGPAASANPGSWGLKGSGALDRPAYKDR